MLCVSKWSVKELRPTCRSLVRKNRAKGDCERFIQLWKDVENLVSIHVDLCY